MGPEQATGSTSDDVDGGVMIHQLLASLPVKFARDGGGKLMVGLTEGTLAQERFNAVDILKKISPHIKGGGGGRPTFAQGGGSFADGLDEALQEARQVVGI